LTKTKNTTDPRSKDAIHEGAGPVASDSLAAESVRAGGDFGENRDSNPLGVKGANSTLANEDSSNATKLSSVDHASSRKDESDNYNPKSAPEYAGTTNSKGFYGATTDQKDDLRSRQQGGGAGVAPTYVNNVLSHHYDAGKPKGSNLHNLDSGDGKNTSGQDPEVGSENDPGRLGVEKFEKTNSEITGSGSRRSGGEGEGLYDGLSAEEQA
jgi:hypothetical protein